MKKVKQAVEIKYNCRSPKQTAKVLKALKIKTGKTKKGNVSTDSESLSPYKDVPFVHTLLEYRHVKKVLSTYIKRFLEMSAHDGYLYPSFNQTIVDSNRLSSNEVHNVNKHNQHGKAIRNSIVARNGHVFASFDFSQLQLRIIAHYTAKFEMGNEMVHAYRKGVDIHQQTADKLGVERFIGKTINFALCFGCGPKKLRYILSTQNVNKTLTECEQYHKGFFSMYKGLERWSRYIKQFVVSNGYAPSLFGFRKPLERPRERRQQFYFEHCCVNAPIMASESQITKLAMINVFTKLNLFPCIHVHDDLTYEIPIEEDYTKTKETIINLMIEKNPLCVPLEVGCKISDKWGGL